MGVHALSAGNDFGMRIRMYTSFPALCLCRDSRHPSDVTRLALVKILGRLRYLCYITLYNSRLFSFLKERIAAVKLQVADGPLGRLLSASFYD